MLAKAKQLDADDALAHFRGRFVFADADLFYFLPNSLGRLSVATQMRMQEVVEQEWGDRLIRGWNEGWIDSPQRIGGKIAQLVGAQTDEVLLADSTSVNLFKLAVAALRARPGRAKIITDSLNFPSDIYVLQAAIDAAGGQHELVIIESQDDVYAPVESLISAIDDQTALVSLSHVLYRSGFVYDMARVTQAVHAVGALTLWDLSHSVGAMDVHLNQTGADLAVGCTYKYLNGGPGAPAFLYVRRDLQDSLHNPLAGWMGQNKPFEFGLEYRSAPGIARFLTGTPSILSLSAVEPGVDLLLEAGIEAVQAKSAKMTGFLLELWETHLAPLGFVLKSPREARLRGSHVTLGHPAGLGISLALKKEKNIIPDFRPPDNIRFAVAPLYMRYESLYLAVKALQDVVENRIYERYMTIVPKVT